MPRRRETTSNDEDAPRTPRASRQLPGPARAVQPIAPAPVETPTPQASAQARLVGIVNKHFPDKGFGFIREDKTAREYFFHYEGTREGTREAFDAYGEGMRVQFEGRNSPKGWRASAVELL